MDTSRARTNGRRIFRLEGLEGRTLLSTARPSGIAAEVVSAKAGAAPAVIHSTIQGHMAPQGLYSGTLKGFTSYSGHGGTGNVGNVFLGAQHVQAVSTVNASAVNITAGAAILTTIKGDQITFRYSGTGTVVNRSKTSVVLLGSITGGTGRFTSATGTVSAVGAIRSGVNGKFVLTTTFNITYPTI